MKNVFPSQAGSSATPWVTQSNSGLDGGEHEPGHAPATARSNKFSELKNKVKKLLSKKSDNATSTRPPALTYPLPETDSLASRGPGLFPYSPGGVRPIDDVNPRATIPTFCPLNYPAVTAYQGTNPIQPHKPYVLPETDSLASRGPRLAPNSLRGRGMDVINDASLGAMISQLPKGNKRGMDVINDASLGAMISQLPKGNEASQLDFNGATYPIADMLNLRTYNKPTQYKFKHHSGVDSSEDAEEEEQILFEERLLEEQLQEQEQERQLNEQIDSYACNLAYEQQVEFDRQQEAQREDALQDD